MKNVPQSSKISSRKCRRKRTGYTKLGDICDFLLTNLRIVAFDILRCRSELSQ